MSMDKGPGETSYNMQFPADIFEADDLKFRRKELYARGIRSRLVLHAETEDTVAYYDLALVGPAHEMHMAPLMFSYYDDSEFNFPRKKRPHKF